MFSTRSYVLFHARTFFCSVHLSFLFLVCVFRKTDVYAEAMGAPAAAEGEEGPASSATIGRAPQKRSARGKDEMQHPLPVNAVRAS